MEELRGNPTAGLDPADFEHALLEAFGRQRGQGKE